jgi:transposase/transposase-like protein
MDSHMTKQQVEVIRSVERRRRWSQEDKERLVAATFESDASVSEIARSAGIHAGQLFCWRKQLCQISEPSTPQFVPVEVVAALPAPDPGETTAPPRLRKKTSIVTIELAARREAEAVAARAQAVNPHSDALLARLRLEIEKLKRDIHGSRSERKARLLEQMELQLEELEADASQDELAAEMAARSSAVRAFERKRPSRKLFPEHLPRERVVIAAPSSCPCCGSAKFAKLGEDITETLEVIPRQWKVIQTVREKFSCRECEKVAQPPAPFHVTPRGFAGPNLLAMILFEKFGQHQPLNRQSERYAREGIDLSLSTLADQVGACAAVLKPVHGLIEAHVLAAERLHGDDTTVPILAKGKTDTGRIWTYVRDDRPFSGASSAAPLYYASRDRRQEHPERHLKTFTGILQADAYGGYIPLFKVDRNPSPLTQALCWSHARRKFFVLADIEREINGLSASERLARRQQDSRSLVDELGAWLRFERTKLSRSSPDTEPIDYMLKRWDGFTTFLADGRICLTNNAAERALRGFAGPDSLCTPSLSICKHWKRLRVSNATRAALSDYRGLNRRRSQVAGPDLIRRTANHLFCGQHLHLNQMASPMIGHA